MILLRNIFSSAYSDTSKWCGLRYEHALTRVGDAYADSAIFFDHDPPLMSQASPRCQKMFLIIHANQSTLNAFDRVAVPWLPMAALSPALTGVPRPFVKDRAESEAQDDRHEDPHVECHSQEHHCEVQGD
jgi:hypothetical protein